MFGGVLVSGRDFDFIIEGCVTEVSDLGVFGFVTEVSDLGVFGFVTEVSDLGVFFSESVCFVGAIFSSVVRFP